MLSAIEKQQILSVISSPHWRTIEQFSEYLCGEIRKEHPIKDTEWETIKTVIFREGQIDGIKRFINELYGQIKEV